MRTINKHPTMVLESLPVKTRFQLTMEEEMLIADTANADAETVRRTLDQAERVLETSDALSDLADTASRIEVATPSEVELIDRVTQTAVAGTDVDSERIAPAMEQYVGGRIATESIAETAKKMLDIVLAFAKKIYERITSYYDQAVVIPGMIKRIDVIIAAINKSGNDIKGKVVGSEVSASYLQINGSTNLAPAALYKDLEALNTAFEYVAENYASVVVIRADEVHKAISSFSVEKAESSATYLAEKMKNLPFNPVPGAGSEGRSKDGASSARTGPALLGNIALQNVSLTVAEGDVVSTLERLRKGGVVLTEMQDGNSDNSAGGEIVYTGKEMINVLTSVKALLTKLVAYPKSAAQITVKQLAGKIQQEAISKSQSMKEAPTEGGSAEDGAGAEEYFKAIVSYNIALATWLEQPAMPLYRSSLNTGRAVVNMVNKMLQGNAAPEA